MRSERPGARFRREKDRRKEIDGESVRVCMKERDGRTGRKKDELRERESERERDSGDEEKSGRNVCVMKKDGMTIRTVGGARGRRKGCVIRKENDEEEFMNETDTEKPMR